MTIKTKRTRIKPVPFIILSLILLSLILGLRLPTIFETNKISDLGYDDETTKIIKTLPIKDTIIKDKLYTETLNDAFKLKDYDQKYLEIYKFKVNITNDEKLIFQRLLNKGYKVNDIAKLILELEFYEITPLLVFDYQEDLNVYIDDVKSNSALNSNYSFTLNNKYIEFYSNIKNISNPKDINANVSKVYSLPSDYVPSDLVQLPIKYAYDGVTMVKVAADAFMKLCDDASELGHSIFANNAYRSYDYQLDLFNSYVNVDGEEKALTYVAKPGSSEHQTGLAVDVDSIGSDGVFENFGQTEAYVWLKENAHKYGFIQRFSNNKSQITGYIQEEWHWRYLGVDLATKVFNSNLTYDEYYELYLKQLPQ